MREKVVVIGGGVAGLTAAHELVERGFDVHLYERKSSVGGKAASRRVGPRKLPGEHGFRFFPGWYRHLPDTMRRIPYKGRRAYFQGASTYDNLITVPSNLLTWFDHDALPLLMRLPRSLDEVGMIGKLGSDLRGLGLGRGEISFFLQKLGAFMAMPDDVRLKELESVTWWAYLECDSKSRAYKDLVAATTRTMVAAKAKEVSAYTIGRLVVRTVFDLATTVDRILNGPSSEVWLDPWRTHLEERGVVFHTGLELESIRFEDGKKKINSVAFEPFSLGVVRRLRRVLPLIAYDRSAVDDMLARGEQAGDKLARFQERLEKNCKSAVQLLGALKAEWNDLGVPARPERKDPRQPFPKTRLLNEWIPSDRRLALFERLARREAEAPIKVEASYFVFPLPLEQMAYYVNRSAMMTFHDPSLRRLVKLANHMDWMAGIQFYLEKPFEFVGEHRARGHLVSMDSEWAITAIEQTQFWREGDQLPSGLKGVISVDIAAWDRVGRFVQKVAADCTEDEIAREVWEQLKASASVGDRGATLRNDMLCGGHLKSKVSFHLDDAVVDLLDRKKQGAYEKARSVRFATGDLEDASDRPDPETPYIWGPRSRFNVEPLLVNRCGSRALRPTARTGIPNMFLAGDYVLTETDLACMEGANEAARRAVNALLMAAGSDAKPCEVWSFTVAGDMASRAVVSGGLQAARSTVAGLRRVSAGATDTFFNATRRLAADLLDRGRADD